MGLTTEHRGKDQFPGSQETGKSVLEHKEKKIPGHSLSVVNSKQSIFM